MRDVKNKFKGERLFLRSNLETERRKLSHGGKRVAGVQYDYLIQFAYLMQRNLTLSFPRKEWEETYIAR